MYMTVTDGDQSEATVPSVAPYGQSTLLHDSGKAGLRPPDYGPPPSQYPPAGHAQYPPQGHGVGPYGAPMYAAPPPGLPQQQQQQVVIVGGPAQQQIINTHRIETFVGQIVLACVVFWCCNPLFGLVAFILAIAASTTAVSNPSCARQVGIASYGVSAAGIIVTVLVIVIVVAVVLSAAGNAVTALADGVPLPVDNAVTMPPLHGCSHYRVGGQCYRHRERHDDSVTYSCIGHATDDGYCYYN